MSFPVRTLLLSPRPLRSSSSSSLAAAARRGYASISTKNPTPSAPLEPSREQAMPIGRFYEAILNTPGPLPDVKPEEPATPAKRGRKPKAAEPAATATASTAPNASPAASQQATAKAAAEAASKSP